MSEREQAGKMTVLVMRALRWALGIESPSLETLAGRGPVVDPVDLFGAERWRDMGLSDAALTRKARRRRRRRAAARANAATETGQDEASGGGG